MLNPTVGSIRENDGSEIRISPVDMGKISAGLFTRVLYQVVVWDF